MYGSPISSTSATNLAQRLIDAASGPANDVARSELRRTIVFNREMMNSTRGPRVLQGHMDANNQTQQFLLAAKPTSLGENLGAIDQLQNHIWASITKPGRIYDEAQRSVQVADHMAEGGGNRRTTVNNGKNMIENMKRSSAYTRPRRDPIKANLAMSNPRTMEGLQPTKSTYIQMNGTGYGYSTPQHSLGHLGPDGGFQYSPPPQHKARAQLRDATRKQFPTL